MSTWNSLALFLIPFKFQIIAPVVDREEVQEWFYSGGHNGFGIFSRCYGSKQVG